MNESLSPVPNPPTRRETDAAPPPGWPGSRDPAAERRSWSETAAIARMRATGLRNLAHLAQLDGDLAAARSLREEALVLLKERRADLLVAIDLVTLGDLATRLGDRSAAIAHYRDALGAAQRLEHVWLSGVARSRLARSVDADAFDAEGVLPAPPRPAGLVDVGGHRLYFHVEGRAHEGRPTVVLEAGLGDNFNTWRHVLPGVSRVAQVVAYSRAGLPPSESGALPRTCRLMVHDLDALLTAAQIAPPYVLVGHSLGCRPQHLFAHRFPKKVLGLIMLDGFDLQTPEERAASLARLPEEQRRDRERWLRGGNPSEHADLITCTDEVEALPLPDVPVVYVASRWAGANYKRDDPAARRKDASVISELVLRRYGAGPSVVMAEESGHCIQVDQPDLVIAVVSELVERVKRGQRD